MQCGTYLKLQTVEPKQVVMARLAAAIVPVPSAFSLKSTPVSGWLAQYKGKSFVGVLKDNHFKLGLLNKHWFGMRWRGSAIVIVGTIENDVVLARLRPPIFILLFSLFWTAALSFAFTLSFYGPSNTLTVHLLLAAMLVLPLALLWWAFLHESRMAERALRDVLGIAAATK